MSPGNTEPCKWCDHQETGPAAQQQLEWHVWNEHLGPATRDHLTSIGYKPGRQRA